jgi:hypothetical protein
MKLSYGFDNFKDGVDIFFVYGNIDNIDSEIAKIQLTTDSEHPKV